MSTTAWIVIGALNGAVIVFGIWYVWRSAKAAPAETGPVDRHESTGRKHASDNFGNDFLAFLLIILGAVGVVGGFFWLLYVILEAVL